MTNKELKAELRSLTKRANQRLRQLEQSGYTESSKAYKYVERLSFDKDKALATTKKGQFKFSTSFAKMNTNELKHLYAEVNRFLSAKTSTVSTIKKIVSDTKKKFEEMTEQKFTDQEYAEFWTDEAVTWFYQQYGSQEVRRLVSVHGMNKAMIIMQRVFNDFQRYNYVADIMEIDKYADRGYSGYHTDSNPFERK